MPGDLHGHSADVSFVFRGTRGGGTASLAVLCAPAGGLLTQLRSAGLPLVPSCLTGGAERADFIGSYIVAAHGRLSPDGIDAVQLECGLDVRQATALSDTAARPADAIVSHVRAPAAARSR